MIVKWLVSYIQFIDWFFTSFYLYVILFLWNYYSEQVICFFTRSDCFLWLHRHCLILYLLSSALLIYDWNDVVGLVDIFNRSGLLLCFELVIILYPLQWFILYLLRPVRLFFYLNYCSRYVIFSITRSDYFEYM